MSPLSRSALPFALACSALAVSACDVLIGIDNFIDCPEDPKCPTTTTTSTSATGGSGGASGTTSATTMGGSGGTSGSTSMSMSMSTSATGGAGGAPPMPTCTDGVKNGSETGKDCGGPCPPCMDGEGCLVGPDCTSKVCKGNLCIAPKCDDLVKNGDETDDDCGGGACSPCIDGKLCAMGSDCVSAVCTGGKCEAATCNDGTKNGTETATDCGGPACVGCAPGLACNGASDCESAICTAGSCTDFRVWGKRFGDAQDQSGSRVNTDSQGSVVLQGKFLGTVDLGGGALVNTYVPDPMDPSAMWTPDYFVAKFQSDGTFVWRKHFPTAFPGGGYQGFATAVDSASNLVLVAPGGGSFNFGGAALPNPAVCPPTCDNIGTGVAKLATNGAHMWSKRFDVTASGEVSGWDVAAEGANLIAVGDLLGTTNFGGGALTSNGYDVFALKLDGNGSHVWSKRFGDASASDQCGRSVATDVAGNVVLAGFFKGGISFGGSTLNAAGGFDIFVAKLSPTGAHLWSKRFGDVQDQTITCSTNQNDITVVVDASGNTILSGRLKGAFTFGGTTFTGGGSDAFVAKFDANGAHVWSKVVTGVTLGRPATDSANAIVLTGKSSGPVTVGSVTLAGSGGFVMKLTASGAHVWSKRLTAIDGRAASATASGHLLLTGALQGTENFGGAPLVSAGATDAFVAKIVNP